MAQRLLPFLAWGLLGLVAFATLVPIGLRPMSGLSSNVERIATFAGLGFVFALAYPHRLPVIIAVVACAAVGFEILQMLVATRHASMRDLGFKLIGGGVGIAAGYLASRLWQRLGSRGS